ncbi:MAG: HK97 gp10 family phage protein [Firmicutes bacterium]|nr:HK97 gp10 family phage protein [Bacillota bacterium]
MTNRVSIQLIGVNELIKNLEAVSDNITKDLTKAVKAGAKIVLDDAKARAPVDTGELRDNMTMRVVEKDRSQVEIDVGPGKDQFYGLFIEQGTSKMAAKPFLRPALDENKEKVQKAITDEIEKAINKAKLKQVKTK